MIAVAVKGAEAVEKRLQNTVGDLRTTVERAVMRGGLEAQRALKVRMAGKLTSDPFWGRGGAQGDFLGTRTGGTVKRIVGGQVLRHGDTVTTSVGSQDRHLLVHEEGGTFSSGSGFFRIPTAAAKTPAGVDRLMGKSIRSMPGMRLVRTKRGKLWGILEGTGWQFNRASGETRVKRAGKASTFMYLFVKSIKLRGRHVFARAREDVRPKLEAITQVDVQAVVRRTNGS